MLKLRSSSRAALLGAAVLLTPFAALAAQSVPFVGCPSDGQQGPVAAPKGQPKTLDLDAAAAKALAWYQAKYSAGALAPRGWKCFSFYGSSGVTLTIAPSGKLDDMSQPLAGAAVTLADDLGGTSGRFAVAKVAARVFAAPAKAFVAAVIAEGIEPQENFPAATIAFRCNTLLGQAAAARAGAVAALLPRYLVADDPALVPLALRPAPLSRDLWLATRADAARSPAVVAVADFLVALFDRERALFSGR